VMKKLLGIVVLGLFKNVVFLKKNLSYKLWQNPIFYLNKVA